MNDEGTTLRIGTFPPVWLYLRPRIWAPSYLSAGIPTPPPPGLTLTFSAGLSGRQPQLTPHGLGTGLPRLLRSFSHTCVPGPTAELRSLSRVCDVSSPVAASANESGGVWQRSEPRPLVWWWRRILRPSTATEVPPVSYVSLGWTRGCAGELSRS